MCCVREDERLPAGKDREAPRELAATGSARLSLRGLLPRPGWGTPHTARRVVWVPRDHRGSPEPCRNRVSGWVASGSRGSCLFSQSQWPWDPKCLVLWQNFSFCFLFLSCRKRKPQACGCFSRQEGLHWETLVSACSFSWSVSSFLVKWPCMELSHRRPVAEAGRVPCCV